MRLITMKRLCIFARMINEMRTHGIRMTGTIVHTLTRSVLLMLAAALLAALANAVSPRKIPWFEDWSRHIETEALKQHILVASVETAHAIAQAGSHIILDARPEADYREGRLPGALSMPFDDIHDRWPEVRQWLLPDVPVLVYCTGLDCDESLLLSIFLKERGRTNLYLFAGGMERWRENQLPVEGDTP